MLMDLFGSSKEGMQAYKQVVIMLTCESTFNK